MLPRTVKGLRPTLEMLCLLIIGNSGFGQDLDPRAYARVPVDATILISGFSYSDGGIVTDVTLPLENGLATVESPSVGIGRTFSLFRSSVYIHDAKLSFQAHCASGERWYYRWEIGTR